MKAIELNIFDIIRVVLKNKVEKFRIHEIFQLYSEHDFKHKVILTQLHSSVPFQIQDIVNKRYDREYFDEINISIIQNWFDNNQVVSVERDGKFIYVNDCVNMNNNNNEQIEKDDKVLHKSGATSSHCPRFDFIPVDALIALAERYELGEKKHGRDNWRKGLQDKDYVLERLNHVIRHAMLLQQKINGEIPFDGDDDAGAILWGGAFAVEALKIWGPNKDEPTTVE